MRLATIVLSALAIGALTADVAPALQQVFFDNGYSAPVWAPGNEANWYSPTATTGGALWIKTGTDDPVLLTQDVNIQLLVQSPTVGWTTLCTMLLSAAGQVPDESNGWVGDANGMYSFFEEPGMYLDPSGMSYKVPGTDGNPSTHYNMRVYAWTGDYDNYAVAYAAAEAHTPDVYVGDSGIFSQTVLVSPPSPPGDIDAMPALVLQQLPVPEPSALLLTGAGLSGLLAYAWRRRK